MIYTFSLGLLITFEQLDSFSRLPEDFIWIDWVLMYQFTYIEWLLIFVGELQFFEDFEISLCISPCR